LPTIAIHPANPNPQNQCPSTAKVEKLCAIVSQKADSNACRGIVHDQEWHYHIHNDPFSVDTGSTKLQSLRDRILGDREKYILTQREKYV